MPLLKAVLLSCLWAFGLGQLEQPEIVISRAADTSASIPCKASISGFGSTVIFWYRQKPNEGLTYLLYVRVSTNKVNFGGKKNKFEASKNSGASTSTLKINFLEKGDEARYYCAYWTGSGTYDKKIFGGGTKLIVTDKVFAGDISPRPTIFLPSVAETHFHKAGTYLCLLENFFPDVIKVYWKEKDGSAVLESYQGDTMKTNDTYMKFSWLTVTGDSMDKEHKCIVTHQNNKGGIDQEILFPPIGKVGNNSNSTEAVLKEEDVVGVTVDPEAFLKGKDVVNTTDPEALRKGENGLLSLQLASTSAYYTYFLLLLKSALHGTFLTFCLCRRSAVCGYPKSTGETETCGSMVSPLFPLPSCIS
uniref:Ig-like domain-containing protein n=1 Tax=Chinchilla lanigera TaxID=34839 RepID=A0A8C2YNI0_CHILA